MLCIVFISMYLFATTELYQLLKLPIFIEHFLDHKSQDKMSMYEFLVHHYGGHEKDADYNTDMKLPFMKHFDLSHFSVFLGTNSSYDTLKELTEWKDSNLVYHSDENFINRALEAIWQPPRFV